MESGDPSISSSSATAFFRRQLSRVSLGESEDEESHDDSNVDEFVPSPFVPLKQQLELDKEDESLQRWKRQLLGGVDLDEDEGEVDPEVQFIGFSILTKGREELDIPLSALSSKAEVAFSLKEGCSYNLKFTFTVKHNLVSGLTYVNTVWRCGTQVDETRIMLGTFSPRMEPYVHVLDEERTPSGIVAQGIYSAKTKFLDDDGRCYLEAAYSFEIRKDW
ncbi:hypothetical protein KP509_19G001300 [Ceratopteris richardii]|uniref:Rho GDP-dissociation inhibitor 1 n=1 Tax=Ceratopteris richardii TaxID=49495 RepID=A0A8T2SJ94_CERRI|nr:hypothetical protein KP509_19G001300 [Ceratopteris richardii]KAH7351522.1 hypothetical protein KP509_19G001300 [Ceratopteris richardii]KAH7351523.1 hypothetical protein KP509_19G001300 [Ceratopteris richardii]